MFAKHPEIAKRFAKETESIKALPEHVGKEKKAMQRPGMLSSRARNRRTFESFLPHIKHYLKKRVLGVPEAISKEKMAMASAFFDEIEKIAAASIKG